MKKLLLILLYLPMIGFGQCISGDCQNGYGTYIYENGDKYIGYFRAGKKHLFGVDTYKNGTTKSGLWEDGNFILLDYDGFLELYFNTMKNEISESEFSEYSVNSVHNYYVCAVKEMMKEYSSIEEALDQSNWKFTKKYENYFAHCLPILEREINGKRYVNIHSHKYIVLKELSIPDIKNGKENFLFEEWYSECLEGLEKYAKKNDFILLDWTKEGYPNQGFNVPADLENDPNLALHCFFTLSGGESFFATWNPHMLLKTYNHITVLDRKIYAEAFPKKAIKKLFKELPDEYSITTRDQKSFMTDNTPSKNIKIKDPTIVEKVSKVDINIPINKKTQHRYALVIGNEDYQSRQRTLNSEQNVDYAVNDATIFREYALKTLGVEEDNMFFLTNATAVEMGQQIDLVVKIMSKLGNKGELIVYYAGHGFPDEKTNIPYLIPVDVSASSLSYAIKLDDFYQKLSAANSKQITIFLDACFTGGGRSSGLIASRGVKIKPKGGTLNGNIVVFSASSGDQSALPYHKENHGMFTYHLLKKLQESKGDIEMGELADYLKDEVSIKSLKVNQKEQDPAVNTSKGVLDVWKNWKF